MRYLKICLIILGLCLGALPCQAAPNAQNQQKETVVNTTATIDQEYDKLIQLGINYHEKGQDDQAIETYQKAISLDPTQETAYRNLIDLQLNVKKSYSQTLTTCQKAVVQIPNFAYAYCIAGYCEMNLQPPKVDDAITAETKAISITEFPVAEGLAQYTLGWAYQEKGEFDLAKQNLLKAVMICQKLKKDQQPTWYPTSLQSLKEVYNRLFLTALVEKKDPRQLLELCREAIFYINGFAFAHTVMGYCFLTIVPSDTEKALASLNIAIMLKEFPEDTGWTDYLFGLVYQKTDQFEKAKPALEKALGKAREQKSTPEWYASANDVLKTVKLNQIRKYIQTNRDPNQIAALCRETISQFDNAAYAYAALGYSYFKMKSKDVDKTIESLNRAIGIAEYPDNDGWTYYILGLAYREKGDLKKAQSPLEKAKLRCETVQTNPESIEWYRSCVAILDGIIIKFRQIPIFNISFEPTQHTQDPYIKEIITYLECQYGREIPGVDSQGFILGLGVGDQIFHAKVGYGGTFETKLSDNLSVSFPYGIGFYLSNERYNYVNYSTNTVTSYQVSNSGYFARAGIGLKYYLDRANGIRLSSGIKL